MPSPAQRQHFLSRRYRVAGFMIVLVWCMCRHEAAEDHAHNMSGSTVGCQGTHWHVLPESLKPPKTTSLFLWSAMRWPERPEGPPLPGSSSQV